MAATSMAANPPPLLSGSLPKNGPNQTPNFFRSSYPNQSISLSSLELIGPQKVKKAFGRQPWLPPPWPPTLLLSSLALSPKMAPIKPPIFFRSSNPNQSLSLSLSLSPSSLELIGPKKIKKLLGGSHGCLPSSSPVFPKMAPIKPPTFPDQATQINLSLSLSGLELTKPKKKKSIRAAAMAASSMAATPRPHLSPQAFRHLHGCPRDALAPSPLLPPPSPHLRRLRCHSFSSPLSHFFFLRSPTITITWFIFSSLCISFFFFNGLNWTHTCLRNPINGG